MAEIRMTGIMGEFFGTFCLLLVAGIIPAAKTQIPSSVGVATAYAVILYAMRSSQAGHCNPAITLAATLVNGTDWKDGVFYVIAQFFGGYLGSFVAWMGTKDTHPYSTSSVGNAFLGIIGNGYTVWQMMLAELLFSALLVFVYLRFLGDSGGIFWATSIAAILVVAASAIGSISGACLNPAMAFGMDLVHVTSGNSVDAGDFFFYILVPLLGSLLAFILYKITSTGVVAELVGTFFIAATIGLEYSVQNQKYFNPSAIALLYMALIYSLAVFSGGHFNPAVSLAVGVAGEERLKGALNGLMLAVAQCTGGVLGGMLSWQITGSTHTQYDLINGSDATKLIILTILFSIALMAMYLISCGQHCGNPPGIAVAGVIFLSLFITQHKAILNPAIAAGNCLTQFIAGYSINVKNIITVVVVPFVGCFLAAGISMAVPKEYQRVNM